jgi:tetratricopeptide (TPR) repeat protein
MARVTPSHRNSEPPAPGSSRKAKAAAVSELAMTQKQRKEKAQELVYEAWEVLESLGRPSAGDLKAAEQIFNSAVVIDPELADAYNGLGCVRFERKHYPEAEAMCRIALEKA